MKFLLYFLVLLYHVYEARTSWNISEEGFLLNSLKYSSLRNTDYFSIVFWTKNHNGILLYCVGDDNYLLLELYHAVLRLSVKYIGEERQEPYEGYIGFGLADNQPHQIEIYRESRSIMLVLDRGEDVALASWPVISSSELIFRINQTYVGGYPDVSIFNRFISLSQTGFVGCIEEAVWNNVNLLYEPFANNSISFCEPGPFNPITFLSPDSYLILNRNHAASGLTLIFDVMIYLQYSTILYHNDGVSTLNISITNGSFLMILSFGTVSYINAFLPMIEINDGFWHKIYVQLPGKQTLEEPIVVFGVDDEIVTTYSSFTYDTSRDLKFGGFGFVGCINNLKVDGIPYSIQSASDSFNLTNNGCLFSDQCVPNPCQHSGYCNLKLKSFSCQCPASYPGDVCDDSYYYLTCSNMFACGYKDPGKQFIDVDGVGPFDPVPVLCNNMQAANENSVITQVDNLLPRGKITFSNEPKTVSVPYALTLNELRLLTLNSYYCTQQVTYECSTSRITQDNTTLLVWQGGDGLIHDYWNSKEEYAACQCFVDNQRCDQKKRCNCDVNDRITRSDSTKFDNKYHLPIIGITAMDISSSTGKSATVEVGPLLCYGIGGQINAVTFQEIFSFLPIDTINFASPGTIEFEFKTDRAQGNVIIFAQGRPQSEYYVMELTNSTAVTVIFAVAGEKYTIEVALKKPMTPLNNLEYHRIYYKINAKYAYLIVDGIMKQIDINYRYDIPIQVNKDNTPFYLGGSPYNMFSGYRGIIRRLKINGELIDLTNIVNKMTSPSGVYPGIFSSCLLSPNPCNFGICVEFFNYYLCQCDTSPYYGKNCENEVGAVFDRPSSSLTYYFSTSNRVIEFFVSVAFRTTKNGLLYLLQGSDLNIFFSLDIYQNNLRLSLNFWPQRTKVANTYMFYNPRPPYIYNDGKTYVVQFRLEAYQFSVLINGVNNIISVPMNHEKDFYINNPRWVYLGNAPPIPEFPGITFSQFIGCLGGMKIRFKYEGKTVTEVIDVMKSVGGTNTKIIGNGVTTGVCVGNLSSPPPAKLIFTPPNMVPGGGGSLTFTGTNTTGPNRIGLSWSPVIAAILILLAFMILLGSTLFLRWYSRNHGTYMTQEGIQLTKNIDQIQSKKREKTSVAFPQLSVDEIEGWYL